MKNVLVILGAVVVLAVIAVLVLASSVDSIVKASVEKVGSEATGTAVTLDAVEISLTSGSGELRGLTIGNPEGFESPSAFSLGLTRLAIDPGSITGDVIVVKEVIIDAPTVTYEVGNDLSTNIGTIQDNLDAFVKRFAGEGGEAEPEGGEEPAEAPPAEEGDGPKIIIEKLRFRGGRVSVSASFLGGEEVGIDLPETSVDDIGKESGGATPAEVAAAILSALTDSVLNAVKDADIDGVSESAGKALEEIEKAAGSEIGKAVKDLFGK